MKRLVKDDDGLLDVATKVTAPLVLLFLVFSYFHSVKPVFDKQVELEQTKEQVGQLRQERQDLGEETRELLSKMDGLRSETTRLKRERDAAQTALTEVGGSLRQARAELRELDRRLGVAREAAVSAHLWRLVGEVTDWAIRRVTGTRQDPIDVQAKCLELAAKELKGIGAPKPDTAKSYEREALLTLQKFAKERMRSPEPSWRAVFDLITYRMEMTDKWSAEGPKSK